MATLYTHQGANIRKTWFPKTVFLLVVIVVVLAGSAAVYFFVLPAEEQESIKLSSGSKEIQDNAYTTESGHKIIKIPLGWKLFHSSSNSEVTGFTFFDEKQPESRIDYIVYGRDPYNSDLKRESEKPSDNLQNRVIVFSGPVTVGGMTGYMTEAKGTIQVFKNKPEITRHVRTYVLEANEKNYSVSYRALESDWKSLQPAFEASIDSAVEGIPL